MSAWARVEAEILLLYLLAHGAQGWYWRTWVMFSWLWENSDALNYCSCSSGSCIILGGREGTTAGLGTLVAAEPWSRALPTGSSGPAPRVQVGTGGVRGSQRLP